MIRKFADRGLTRFIPMAKLLVIYAVTAILLCFLTLSLDGNMVVFALGGLGFFWSIMFPAIFSLSIKGLGANTKPGFPLIVMAFISDAIFLVLMGTIIDKTNDNIQLGYYVSLACFIVVFLFKSKNLKRA